MDSLVLNSPFQKKWSTVESNPSQFSLSRTSTFSFELVNWLRGAVLQTSWTVRFLKHSWIKVQTFSGSVVNISISQKKKKALKPFLLANLWVMNQPKNLYKYIKSDFNSCPRLQLLTCLKNTRTPRVFSSRQSLQTSKFQQPKASFYLVKPKI